MKKYGFYDISVCSKIASPDVKWYYFDLQYGLALNINANVGNCFCKTYTYIYYSITAILLHTEMP